MPLSELQLTREFVQAVREAIDIAAIAREATRLERSGRKLKGLCPLHREKTPSFYVDPELGFFKCFGCGAGGDGISLHMRLTGDDFPAAIAALARRFGVPIPQTAHRRRGPAEPGVPDPEEILSQAERFFVERLEASPEALAYLERRRIPLELARRFRLGFAPAGWRNLLEALQARVPLKHLLELGLVVEPERGGKPYDRFRNRLIFPVRDGAGRLVGFAGRALEEEDPKYLNSSETERFHKGRLLYGLHEARRAIRDGRRALLVEGYVDLLAAVASGIDATVASMGTALTPDQARLLARYAEEVVVGYDGDRAGEEAARRALPMLLQNGLAVYRLELPEGEDPDSFRLARGPEALRQRFAAAPDLLAREIERLAPPEVERSPHARSRAARAIAELLMATEDRIVRLGYAQLAARKLGIPLAELRRPAGLGHQALVAALAPASPENRRIRSGREREAVRTWLASTAQGRPTQLPPWAPPPEAFHDPELRAVYRALLGTSSEKPAARALSELVSSLTELPDAPGLLADLMLELDDAPGVGDLEGALEDIRLRWLKEQRKALGVALEQAERDQDRTRVEQLLAERERLNRELFPRVPRARSS